MASGKQIVFRPLHMNTWIEADFTGMEVSIKPRIQSLDNIMTPRDEYKATLLRLSDENPTLTINELAHVIVRSVTWCAEVLAEAKRERSVEMNYYLVETCIDS